jgi:hypothetical protein
VTNDQQLGVEPQLAWGRFHRHNWPNLIYKGDFPLKSFIEQYVQFLAVQAGLSYSLCWIGMCKMIHWLYATG